MSNLNYWMDKGKEKVKKSKFQPGSDEWLKEVQTSKWGINSEDAHSKPCQDYRNEVVNEDEMNHYINMQKEGGVDNPKAAKRQGKRN